MWLEQSREGPTGSNEKLPFTLAKADVDYRHTKLDIDIVVHNEWI